MVLILFFVVARKECFHAVLEPAVATICSFLVLVVTLPSDFWLTYLILFYLFSLLILLNRNLHYASIFGVSTIVFILSGRLSISIGFSVCYNMSTIAIYFDIHRVLSKI